MNLAFLVAVCSCNVILGENFKSEMGFMEERIERTEADESRQVYMEVMDNASRLAVISTVVMMFNLIKEFTECFLASCRCQLYVIS